MEATGLSMERGESSEGSEGSASEVCCGNRLGRAGRERKQWQIWRNVQTVLAC